MEELTLEIRGDVGASREKMNGDCGQRRGSAEPPGRKFRLGFPGGSDSEESACNVGDRGLILGLGRSSEEGVAIHSRFLAWRIPWTEEPGGLYSPWGRRDSDMTEH